MRSGLNVKLATLAITTFSLLTASSTTAVQAGSLKFAATDLSPLLSVKSTSVELDLEQVDQNNWSNLSGFTEILDDHHHVVMDDVIDLTPDTNQSVDLSSVVNRSKSQSNSSQWTNSDLDVDTPRFFGGLILSISLMGSIMTVTPMMLMKHKI
jgi:hypothetical protein